METLNGPAVYVCGPDTSVRVPLDGVDAKLIHPSDAPIEQRKKAAKRRGLKMPDLELGFFFIDVVGVAVENCRYY